MQTIFDLDVSPIDKTLLAPKPPPLVATRNQKETRLKQGAETKPPVRNQLYIAHGSFISIESDSSTQLTQTLEPLTLETINW